MGLSVIIVNYKTAGLVLDCLASFLSGNRDVLSEVIVADNHSGDGLEQMLREKYPEVIFIDTGYNAGFARANNAAIRRCRGDAVLLLNADTLVSGNAIAQCYHRLMASSFSAAGVQLMNPDNSPQISGNFVMKGGLNYLLPLPYTGRFLRALALGLGTKKPNVPEATGPVEVDWINGAFLMVKKTAVDAAGLLDEDFFLYAEEAEWCHRIRKTGNLILYGDLHVVHLQGVSAGAAFGSEAKGYMVLSDKKGRQIMVSNFLRIRKEFGIHWLLFQYLVYFITIPVSLICSLIDFSFFYRAGKISRWAGFASNVLRLGAWLPKMIMGKPGFYKVL